MLLSPKVFGRIAVIGAVLGLAGGAYGLTAANTVPTSKAGDGSGAVSGYTVTAIHYALDTTTPNPSNVKKLTFTLDTAPAAGSTLQVKVGGTWYACTNVTTAVTCDTTVGTQLTVAAATSIEAVVAD
jgi:hypothetical protein